MLRNTTQPVRAVAFWELIREELPKLPASQGSRYDVVTSLDPVLQVDAEFSLEAAGRGEYSVPFYFDKSLRRVPQSLLAPAANKWSGSAGSLDLISPMILLRAFVPDRNDRAQFTLTSQVIAPSAPQAR